MQDHKTTIALFLIFFTTTFGSCSSDTSNKPEPKSETIELENAKLTDFPLFGITPISIQIIDPVIVNNEEIEFGKINIVIPHSISLDKIASSVSSNELDLSTVDILPGNNTTLNYETESHIHTLVTALDKSEELLHYTVTIKQETAPTPSSLTVTDFKFEASKNPQLTKDVTIERRVDDTNRQDIYLFVPVGTDFSSLTPTATFDAEAVFYTQVSSIPIVDVDTPYPTEETRFDFAYPQRFIIVLKDEPNNRIKWVNVFVDVKNPVQLEQSALTTPDVLASGSSSRFEGITKWKNVGNHKLEFGSATTYEDKVPDVSLNVLTANRQFTSLGLPPGESAAVSVLVAGNLPVGEYKTTAVFYSDFYGTTGIDDLVEPVKLSITTKVINQ